MIPNAFKKNVFNADVDFINDTIKVELLTSSHSSNEDSQEFIADVSANEVSGTNYSAGGATLTGKSVSQDDTDNEGVFTANDVTWADADGFTARYAAVYKDTGNPATSPIITIIDLGEDKPAGGGDFVLNWDAEGIVNATN